MSQHESDHLNNITNNFEPMVVYNLFVTTASTETLNSTSLGVTYVSSPPCPKRTVTPKAIPFDKDTSLRSLHDVITHKCY